MSVKRTQKFWVDYYTNRLKLSLTPKARAWVEMRLEQAKQGILKEVDILSIIS